MAKFDWPNLFQFAIYVVNVNTLQTTKVFEDKKVGFPGIEFNLRINIVTENGFGVRPLIWFNNSLILFQAELTGTFFSLDRFFFDNLGWVHVYAAQASGEKYISLVTGECEVQDYIPYGNYVYLSSNCDLIDSRSITRINLMDGTKTVLIPGNLHTVAGMADSGFGMAPLNQGVAYIKTTYNNATRVFVWQGNDKAISGNSPRYTK